MPLTIIFQVMLRFIVNNGRCKDVGGIALWQLMEERQVLHGHSWQSMKERFRSSIVGNLDFFDFFTKEEKRELRKHKARHVPTAPLDSTAASTALTTSALSSITVSVATSAATTIEPVAFSSSLISALAPAFPSSMRSMLTHTPMPALSVHEPQDELLADLPDPPYVPAGGERARKRRGSNLPTPPARRARLRSGSRTDFLIN